MGRLNFRDMNRLSLVSVRVEQRRGDTFIGHGTGFLVRPPSEEGQVWLVTAWHVATARSPSEPAKTIEGYQEGPDTLWFRTLLLPGMPQWSMLASDRVDLTRETVWREHKDRASGVDVVAIHLPHAYRPTSFDLPWEMVKGGTAPVAGTDAMIVGFPFSFEEAGTKGEELDPPIWKRATVASEPRSSAYGQNRFLVDALSLPGMSGAPIFRVRHAGEPVLDEVFETLTKQYDGERLAARNTRRVWRAPHCPSRHRPRSTTSSPGSIPGVWPLEGSAGISASRSCRK